MDTGKGEFVQVEGDGLTEEEMQEVILGTEAKHPGHKGWFKEGEILEIRGSRFRIQSIKPKSMRLKLLKRKV